MGLVVFAILGLPIGNGVLSLVTTPTMLHLFAGFLLYDVGFDAVLLYAGRGDMLTIRTPRRILGHALERWTLSS